LATRILLPYLIVQVSFVFERWQYVCSSKLTDSQLHKMLRLQSDRTLNASTHQKAIAQTPEFITKRAIALNSY